jgi:Xaa-Pro aminopeptidase
MTDRVPSVVLRLLRARTRLAEFSLDAFVVSHLTNIRYLTGFSASAGLLVLTKNRAVLIVDFRYQTSARALAAAPALADHLSVLVPPASYDETLTDYLIEIGARRIGVEAASMTVGRFTRLSNALAARAPTPLQTPSQKPVPVLMAIDRFVEAARMIKDAEEIETLKEAGKRLGRLVPSVIELAKPGRLELDVAHDIDGLLRRAGFERPAFETIVASGPNSALPHARPGKRTLQPGDGVVLDFGGVYDGYCVDLTRTVQLGEGAEGFRRLFAAVAEAQRAAIAAVRPGVRASDVDAAARAALGRYGLEEAFGHGTGHGLGLEVHEDPRVGRPIKGQPDEMLEPGMVFTVEPGVYVEGVGGVRIEDDVLVTGDGCEVITGG